VCTSNLAHVKGQLIYGALWLYLVGWLRPLQVVRAYGYVNVTRNSWVGYCRDSREAVAIIGAGSAAIGVRTLQWFYQPIANWKQRPGSIAGNLCPIVARNKTDSCGLRLAVGCIIQRWYHTISSYPTKNLGRCHFWFWKLIIWASAVDFVGTKSFQGMLLRLIAIIIWWASFAMTFVSRNLGVNELRASPRVP